MPETELREHGRLVDVSTRVAGDELDVAAAAGHTALSLYDVADFDEGGGQLMVGGRRLTYTAIDDESATLTLASPLTGATIGANERVEVYPQARDMWAQVSAGDGDTIAAKVPHDKRIQLPEGVRDQTEAEQVTIVERDGRWEIEDVHGGGPVIAGDPVELHGRVRSVDANGETTIDLDGKTGRLTAVGSIATGRLGQPRVVQEDSVTNNRAATLYETGRSQEAVPAQVRSAYVDAENQYKLVLQSGTEGSDVPARVEVSRSPASTRVELQADRLDITANRSHWIGAGGAELLFRNSFGGQRTNATLDATLVKIDTGAGGGVLRLYGDRVAARTGDDGASAILKVAGSAVVFEGDGGSSVRFRGAPSATGAGQFTSLTDNVALTFRPDALEATNAAGGVLVPFRASTIGGGSSLQRKRNVRALGVNRSAGLSLGGITEPVAGGVPEPAVIKAFGVDTITYQRTDDDGTPLEGTVYVGVSAESVQEAVPDAYIPPRSGEDDSKGAVDIGALAALALAGVKELSLRQSRVEITADFINGKTITGALIRTAATGARTTLGGGPYAGRDVQFYSGSGSEIEPGAIEVNTASTSGSVYGTLYMGTPATRATDFGHGFLPYTNAALEMRSRTANGTFGSEVLVQADVFNTGTYVETVTLAAAGGKIGVLGTAPITKRSITGSRAGETAADASLRAAFCAFGYATDNTTA